MGAIVWNFETYPEQYKELVMLKSMFKLHFSVEPNGALCPNHLGLALASKDIFPILLF